MQPERRATLQALTMAVDLTVLVALWWVVPDVRAWLGAHWPFDLVPGPEAVLRPLDPDGVRAVGLVLVPVWMAALHLRGAWRHPEAPRSSQLALAWTCALALGAGLSLLYLLQLADVSRTVLVGYALAAWAGLGVNRVVVRSVARWWRAPSWHVALVGSPEAVSASGAWVQGHPEQAATVVARVHGSPVLDHVWAAVRAGPVDEVRWVGPLGRPGELEEVVALCAELGMVVTVRPEAWGTAAVSARAGTNVLTFAPADGQGLLVKRLIDVVGALVGLVVLGPVMLLAALAVRSADGGPAFFVQERVGLHGRVFRMWKLRTMRPDAEAHLEALSPRNETGGVAFKMRHDPRVTPVGAWLRRWSIDELPQLVHVLRGEMSLVGPRPATVDEVARYDRKLRRRLSVRPGLTCTWQVSGRSDLDWETWMVMDLTYVEQRSLALDLWLLARTVPAVMWGRGAR